MLKRLLFPALLILVFMLLTVPVRAQTSIPTATSQLEGTGMVTGVIVNRTQGGTIPESLSVMLHVLDQNYNQLGMLHAQSQPDGSFLFEDVPLSPELLYVGFVTYQGASYNSQPVSFDGKTTPNIELPVYGTTNDLSNVQVDEMHVLFNFAEDGLEVNEIYLISNLGNSTVTGTLTLDDGQPATIEFPLPAGADYVFFKPDTSDRFVELDSSFTDKAPLVPGERSSQIMVSYLLPYFDEMSYSYTAPLTVRNIDFLIPAEEGMILQGPNLLGPEITTLQDQSIYQVYTYKGLSAGETVSFDLLGKPNFEVISGADNSLAKPAVSTSKLAIEIGSGVFGLVMIAFGIWQWRRSRSDDSEADTADDTDEVNPYEEVIVKIAHLDDARDWGEIDELEYAHQRAALRKQAKILLEKDDE